MDLQTSKRPEFTYDYSILKNGGTTKEKLQYLRSAISLVVKSTKRRRPMLFPLDRIECYVILLVVLSAIYEYNSMNVAFSSAMIAKYMVDRDAGRMRNVLLRMGMYALHSAFCLSAKSYVVEMVVRYLRESLTATLNERYFASDAYYRLGRAVDNPDHRLTSDVHEFSQKLVAALDKFLLSPILLVYFSWKVVESVGWVPLFCLYGFFSFGIILQKLLLPFLIKPTKEMDAREGDYRFIHAVVRDQAEPIFLSRTGARFRKEVEWHFQKLLELYPLLLALKFLSTAVGNIFAFAGGVANYVILSFCVDLNALSGGDMSARISAGSFITLSLIRKISEFVQVGSFVSDISAYSQRITEFHRLAGQSEYPSRAQNHGNILNSDLEMTEILPSIVFLDVELISPDQQCHIRGFDLQVREGSHVFISGPNGSGKTSLVRLMMGMWQPIQGRILIQGGAQVDCAPQVSIVYSGSLLDQLGLTWGDSTVNNEKIEEEASKVLFAVKLSSLVVRCGGLNNYWPRSQWISHLSPGEIQRLALARVLLRRPHFAILDEATSSIDPHSEGQIYQEFWARGITTVTIAHRLEAALMEKMAVFVTLEGRGVHSIRKKGELLAFDWRHRRSLA